MAIPARQRWIVYALALALALVAARWAGGQDRADGRNAGGQTARPARDATPDAARTEALPEVRLDRLGKRVAPAPAGDPFQSQSWDPPVEKTARRNLPPPRPEAPPIPFAYMGKMVDDATTIVFLRRQDRNYIVRAGDTIDGTYRVEKVGDDALELVYLPLGARQALPFAPTDALPSVKPNKPMADEDDD